MIRHPNAQLSDNVMAYDNAVSALGKICQFHRDSINATQVYTFWCSMSLLSFKILLFTLMSFGKL